MNNFFRNLSSELASRRRRRGGEAEDAADGDVVGEGGIFVEDEGVEERGVFPIVVAGRRRRRREKGVGGEDVVEAEAFVGGAVLDGALGVVGEAAVGGGVEVAEGVDDAGAFEQGGEGGAFLGGEAGLLFDGGEAFVLGFVGLGVGGVIFGEEVVEIGSRVEIVDIGNAVRHVEVAYHQNGAVDGGGVAFQRAVPAAGLDARLQTVQLLP
mmetsp:Transcript_18978/g.58490  ORF Transcript_18978/g.58490 Transcript_18978/m.58490 type:complete len:210 (-) Transcript_18978:493-1122(-)